MGKHKENCQNFSKKELKAIEFSADVLCSAHSSGNLGRENHIESLKRVGNIPNIVASYERYLIEGEEYKNYEIRFLKKLNRI